MLLSCKHELENLKLKHAQLKEEYEAKLKVLKAQNKEQANVIKECKLKLGEQFKQIGKFDISKKNREIQTEAI